MIVYNLHFIRSGVRPYETDSVLVDSPDVPLLSLQGYDSGLELLPEGWHGYGVHAAYTHVHFGAQPHLAQRFVEHCAGTATAKLEK